MRKYIFKAKRSLFIAIWMFSVMQVTSLNAQNLIPDKPLGTLYNYYCTWAIQNYLYGWGKPTLTLDSVLWYNGANARMNEKYLTGDDSWLHFYKRIHGDLIFLFDDGYNTPAKDGMEIDQKKFPSLKGNPAERQKQLCDLVKKEGWATVGLWSRGIKSISEARERILWSKYAKIGYWKVDGGDDKCIYDSLRNILYPELIIEHAIWPGVNVANNGPKGSLMADYGSKRVYFLEHTDVVRIYDIDQPMGQVTGLARVAGLLAVANGNNKAKAVINCEDLVTVGAALGCSYGIFRFPVTGKRPQGDPDIFNAGPRQTKKRIDEVVRAVRWQRIAPPFSAGKQPVIVDTALLTDQMTIKKGESWDINIPGLLIQSAPARITRGLPLPIVKADGEIPFVIASRHPNGAVSIATLGRHSDSYGYKIPLADISFQIGVVPIAIGIFGYYKSLALNFNDSMENRRILAQDLAGDKAVDITNKVSIKGRQIVLSGNLISQTGLRDATPGDVSDPGLIIVIK